jgi:hypothetical protein
MEALRMQQGKLAIRQLGRSLTFTEAYVQKVLDKCNGVQLGVMDFRYFESMLKTVAPFEDNFCVTMCKPRKIQALLRGANLQKAATHDRERLQRAEQFLEGEHDFEPAEDWGMLRVAALHATNLWAMDAAMVEERIENTADIKNSRAASETWSRDDELARKMKKLDKTVEMAQQDLGLKMDSDDFDVAREIGDGMWKPFGQMGTASALGMRPPILATRLRWIGLDMRMLRMLSGKGEDSHLTVHMSDHMEYESESVDQVRDTLLVASLLPAPCSLLFP